MSECPYCRTVDSNPIVILDFVLCRQCGLSYKKTRKVATKKGGGMMKINLKTFPYRFKGCPQIIDDYPHSFAPCNICPSVFICTWKKDFEAELRGIYKVRREMGHSKPVIRIKEVLGT